MSKFLTVAEVAPLLKLDSQGLYRAIRTGQFPVFVKIGAKIRIPEDRLKEWIDQQIKKNQSNAETTKAA